LGGLHGLVVRDFRYFSERGLPGLLGLALVSACFALLVLRSPRRDQFFLLHRALLAGAVIFLALSVNYTYLRLELVAVPPLAVGFALALSWARNWVSATLPAPHHG
jgi:hypothetical protein